MKLSQLNPALLAFFALMLQQPTAGTIADPARKQDEPHAKIVCPATAQNPRNSEADVEVLRDGSLLMAYTEFYGGNGTDWGKARIAAKTSKDLGHSWSDSFTLVENQGQMNVMSPSLLRLKSGKLAMIYMVKNSESDCRVLYLTSSNEGKTWTQPRGVTPSIRYWGMNNDRLVQLKSGRLLAPVWSVEDWRKSHHTRGVVFYSDDEGQSWKAGSEVDIPQGPRGVDEPAVIELKDGRVLMMIRSDLGKVFKSLSSDAGLSWSQPEALPLDSPTAPGSIARIPSTHDLLFVWNNSPKGPKHTQDRFPLTAAISHDEGKTWGKIKNVDATPGFTYAYTSLTFLSPKSLLMTYYSSNNDSGNAQGELETGQHLISLKLKILPVQWFYE
jgi:sialidase-1